MPSACSRRWGCRMTDARKFGMAAAVVAAVGFAGPQQARADEGMWLPSQLPAIAEKLRAAGYQDEHAAAADLHRPAVNAVANGRDTGRERVGHGLENWGGGE